MTRTEFRWKVFDPERNMIASTRHIEDAAALVARHGCGAKIKDGRNNHRVVWTEIIDGFGADTDQVARVVSAKTDQWDQEAGR